MIEQGTLVTIENAELVFRNFAGRPTPVNPVGGKREFCVFVDDATAAKMDTDGWAIKMTNVREEGDVPRAYLPVRVNFANRPPQITMLTSRARTRLTEDMVETLDYADIAKVDLVIKASLWDVNGKQGVKAYLKTMFVTIAEDDLERKYAVDGEG